MRSARVTKVFDLLLLLALVLGLGAVARADALGSLAVTVATAGGAMQGATVTAVCGSTQRTGTTDGSGHVTFTGLPAGTCTVTAAASGYLAATASVKVKTGTASVRITLPKGKPGTPVTPVVVTRPKNDKERARKDMAPPPMRQPSSKILRSVAPSPAAPAGIATNGPPMPDDQGHNTEAYSRIDDNPYYVTATAPLSTFSSDVDTASYSNLRRFLRDGTLPPKDAVRIEEMINYFKYDYPAPAKGEPISITSEVGPSPWNPKHQLVRIGLAAPAIADSQVPARNLVFLLDVSGSMMNADKLPLVKQGMSLLVDTLRPQDTIAIVVYAGASGLALPATSGKEKDKIRQAIFALEAGGSTNGAAGIELAYDIAVKHKKPKGINRVILCTDGDFNVGPSSEGDLTRLIEEKREKGVFLTVLGFGTGNTKDATMEKLADRGNGNYGYIDTITEARKMLVKEAGATLVTVAKDVKLQVEFNPAQVAGYRLIGYENRVMRNEDFNDDKKDAGDLGAGHTVTAIYEIVPAGVEVPGAKVDELKYQNKPTTTTGAAASKELMTVKVRYKAPDGAASKLMSRTVTAATTELAKTSIDFRWTAAIAGFGMILRESPHKGTATWAQVLSLAEGARGRDAAGYRKQAIEMMAVASKLKR